MKQSTVEWVEKAEGDWKIAQRAYRARKDPVYDAACFHCQQCVEKYLKARLNEAGIGFAKTHDLIVLLGTVLPLEPSWTVFQAALVVLNHYAVHYRYPGFTATQIEAKTALKECREIRRIIRTAFGLPV